MWREAVHGKTIDIMIIKLVINIITNDILIFSSSFSKLYNQLGRKN